MRRYGLMVSSVPLTMVRNGERCRRFVFRINVLVCRFATSQKPRIIRTGRQSARTCVPCRNIRRSASLQMDGITNDFRDRIWPESCDLVALVGPAAVDYAGIQVGNL